MKRAIFISAFLLVLAVCAIFIIPLNIPDASAENTGSASTIKSPDVPTVTVTAEIDSNSDCCSYCGRPGHTYDYCAQRSIDDYGATGRWVIPSLGIDVACYYYPTFCPEEEIADKMESLVATAQAIVDAPDSAWLGDSFVDQIIGDHASQGFDALYACTEGTRAYMDYGAYRQEYICVGVEQGYNLDTDTTDELNNSVNYKNAGGIRCETCNDSKGVSITIAYFQPVR